MAKPLVKHPPHVNTHGDQLFHSEWSKWRIQNIEPHTLNAKTRKGFGEGTRLMSVAKCKELIEAAYTAGWYFARRTYGDF